MWMILAAPSINNVALGLPPTDHKFSWIEAVTQLAADRRIEIGLVCDSLVVSLFATFCLLYMFTIPCLVKKQIKPGWR